MKMLERNNGTGDAFLSEILSYAFMLFILADQIKESRCFE